MKYSAAFALAAAQLAYSHATFQSFVVNGQDDTSAVQKPSNGNNPILSVSDKAMTCNGGSKASKFLDVKAGSELVMQWHHNNPASDGDADEPIAESHHGPVMVYIAPAKSNGEGAVWTKIYEDGLKGGKWGIDTFRENKGKISITLPDLADGEYLIRPELIALHEANNQGKAQFYNGCGQIKVSGGKTALPSSGVDMTKAYKATDPGVLVNIYSNLDSYTVPGPKVWNGSGSGSSTSPAAKPAVSSTAPVEEAPAATPAPSTGNDNSSDNTSGALPETFTLDQFISWLKSNAGSTEAKRMIRSIAGRAHARDFA